MIRQLIAEYNHSDEVDSYDATFSIFGDGVPLLTQ
jgi:hypothetical protein